MGAVVSRQTISATGQYLLVAAGTGYGQGGWQIAVVGASWTGSGVLKQRTSPPGSAVTLGSAITYYLVNDGTSSTAAITAAANVIVQDVGSDLYFDYTHTSGTVTITVMAAGELIGSEEGMLPVLNPVFAGTITGPAIVYSTKLSSVTALATPSALTATALNAFASTVSGATLMGYGTTADVTLKNRAGTDVLKIGPNTTAAVFAGDLTAGAASFTTGAFSGLVLAGTASVPAGGESAILKAVGNIAIYNAVGVDATTTAWLNFIKTGSKAYSIGVGAGSGAASNIVWNSDTNGSGTDLMTLSNAGALSVTGNLTVGASTFVVTAATGAVAMTGALTGVTTATASSDIMAGAAAYLGFTGRSALSSSADGHLKLSNAAGTAFSNLYYGAQAGATTSHRLQKAIAAITDNTDTAVFTVTVPNGAHSAMVRCVLVGSLGAGGAVGANEASQSVAYDIAIARTAGVATVATASSVYGSANSAVAGAATITVAGSVSAMTGAVGDPQTFSIYVKVTKGGGASDNHTCVAIAEILNANATGISIA